MNETTTIIKRKAFALTFIENRWHEFLYFGSACSVLDMNTNQVSGWIMHLNKMRMRIPTCSLFNSKVASSENE